MPEPTLRVRRSARRFPAKTLRDTMCEVLELLQEPLVERARAIRRAVRRRGRRGDRLRRPEQRPLLGFLRRLEDLGDDRVGLDAFGLALEVQDQRWRSAGGATWRMSSIATA